MTIFKSKHHGSSENTAAAPSAPPGVRDALQLTRDRISELYKQQADDCKAGKEKDLLYSAENPFSGGWLPSDTAATTLPSTYRDMTCFDDATYVSEKLFGADRAFQESLDFETALLLKFVILRRLDVESAAERFLTFRKLILDHGLKWTVDDPNVASGLNAGVFFCIPIIEPREKRPVISVLVREIGFDKHSVEDFKMSWFYSMMTLISWTPTAQTDGIYICVDLKGVSWANQVEGDLRRFLTDGIKHAMPVRIVHAYFANAPGLFKVVWPIIRHLVGTKLKKMISSIGDSYDRVLKVMPPNCIPEDMGGTRPLTAEMTKKALPFYDVRQKDSVPSTAELTGASSVAPKTDGEHHNASHVAEEKDIEEEIAATA